MRQDSTNGRRVALVTGGSRGIGRAIVETLATDDWQVYLCSQQRDSLAGSLTELRRNYPKRVSGWLCDVGNAEQVDELVGRVVNEAGRIDCLVNNAGVGVFAPIDQISTAQWQRSVRTNLDGAFYAMRAASRHMRTRKSGWIINIVSLAGKHPFARGAAYNATKAGLLALSEAAMLDLRDDGIRVAAILPGSVRTHFSHPEPETDDSWKLAPGDVARAVADLLAYPERALPSVIELRPTRPPVR